MSASLPPAGIGLVADAGLRIVDGGRLLIGGSPLRIVRLTDAGAAVVHAWLGGTALASVNSARSLARRLLDAGLVHPVLSPDTDPAPVTVIVPSWNDAGSLEQLLPTVAHPTVVVDDASRHPAAIEDVCAAVGATLIRRDVNGGPAAARTSGLASVTSDFVAFVDSDVVMAAGWWEQLAPHFDDPVVVAVAPRVRSVAGPSVRERYERVHSPLDMGDRPANVGPKKTVSYVPSAMLVVRRSALETAGGFDQAFRFGEDVDLIWRLAALGTVRYAPEVEVSHEPRRSWFRLLRQRMQYGSSAAPLTARHGNVVAPARCSRWSLAGWGVAIGGHTLAGAAIAGASSAALVGKLDGIPDATREAARIAGWGHLHAGRGLARAISRVWWPIALPVAAVHRRVRAGVIAAMVVPALWDWWKGKRPTDPVRSVALRIADDMAYGVGVWSGMIRHRDFRAIVPDVTEWPGRRTAVENATVSRP